MEQKQSRWPQRYASSKLQLTYPLSRVDTRDTSVSKKRNTQEMASEVWSLPGVKGRKKLWEKVDYRKNYLIEYKLF